MGIFRKLFRSGAWPEEDDKPDARERRIVARRPIPRERMKLLYTSSSLLRGADEGRLSIGVDGTSRNYSRRDVAWALRVTELAARAEKASDSEAIHLYFRALELAPGCDLYLINVGLRYAGMGNSDKGLFFLRRAAEITSPSSWKLQFRDKVEELGLRDRLMS